MRTVKSGRRSFPPHSLPLGVREVFLRFGFLEFAGFKNLFAVQTFHKLSVIVVGDDLDASMGTMRRHRLVILFVGVVSVPLA